MSSETNSSAHVIRKVEFRMAMQEAFHWRLPLPDKLLESLAKSEDFERLLDETQSDNARFGLEHFQKFAADSRVEFLVKELLAAEGNYLTPLVRRIVPLLWEKFDELLRWLLRLPTSKGDEPKGRRPVPVFKTTVLALASYGAYFVYHHPLPIDLATTGISTIHIEAAPIKVEPATLSLAPVKLNAGNIKFGQIQLADLNVRPVSFADPQFKITSVPDLKIADGGKIHLDTSSAHIDITQPKPFNVDPLEFKQGTQIPVTFDSQLLKPGGSALQLAVHHDFLLGSGRFPTVQVRDQRNGLFWPSHDYTLTIKDEDQSSRKATKPQSGAPGQE
jgi:hypothetical protein